MKAASAAAELVVKRFVVTSGVERREPVASDQPFVNAEESRVVAPVNAGVPLAQVVRALDAAGVATTDLHRREATLDDVFLALTEPIERSMEVAA